MKIKKLFNKFYISKKTLLSNYKKEKITKKSTIVTIIIISILIILSGISCARYINDKLIVSQTKVARPILELVNGNAIQITNNNTEGEYSFKVKNYNKNNEITEVGLTYNIEIITKKDDSIMYELYKDGEKLQMINNKTINNNFSINKKEEHNYNLKIIYDKNLNKEGALDLMQDIQVKIHSEQERV